jgi:hypothetical protein
MSAGFSAFLDILGRRQTAITAKAHDCTHAEEEAAVADAAEADDSACDVEGVVMSIGKRAAPTLPASLAKPSSSMDAIPDSSAASEDEEDYAGSGRSAEVRRLLATFFELQRERAHAYRAFDE